MFHSFFKYLVSTDIKIHSLVLISLCCKACCYDSRRGRIFTQLSSLFAQNAAYYEFTKRNHKTGTNMAPLFLNLMHLCNFLN
mmetsp:Transcript_55802/g.116739  ORF Transcript_55802/g.116739 Transcript_55802/m.116739 type:complete len:82 (-) Transcript_55802:1200-1445(-)